MNELAPMASASDPSPECLYECIRRHALAHPDAEAAVEPGRRLSASQLCAAVDRCAAALVGVGVERGDRVATLAPPGLDFLVTFLATVSVGGIWVGLNPRHTEAELNDVVRRIEPSVVFVTGTIEQQSYRPRAAALPPGVCSVECGNARASADDRTGFECFLQRGDATSAEPLARRRGEVRPEDPCLMVFTSGSTGTPKGVLITQAALVGTSRVQVREWPATPLRVLDNLPINHIGCVGDLCCYALVGGGTVVFQPRFDPAATLATIRDEGITVWGQVPTMFQLTLDAPGFDPAMLASLQRIFWGGAHAAPELIERLAPLAPRLATSYSQTETVGSVTFTSVDATRADLQGTVGRPVAPYEVRIADTEDRPVTAGEEGEVHVRTPFGYAGFWRDPTAGAQATTSDGWHRTGDVGRFTRQGDLELLGRVHDVFKSGGYNIYPPEIEASLTACTGVEQAAVVGMPDDLYGHVGVAFVVASGPSVTADSLRAALRVGLANYKVPKRFVFIDELPRLAVGKVDKKALLAKLESAL